MEKFTFTIDLVFGQDDLDLKMSSDVEGDLDSVQAAMALFFKKSMQAQAEHVANQAVDYGSVVKALLEAADGYDDDNWDD